MSQYKLSEEDLIRIKTFDFKIKAIDDSIVKLINEKTSTMATYSDIWKEIRNKYDMLEPLEKLYLDYNINTVRSRP